MSEAVYEFDAELRTDAGKGASRRLRREGKVPGIIYGGNKKPVAIALDHDKVNNASGFESFYSHILTLHLDGKKQQVILKDLQRHPYKLKLTHMDFQRVSAKEELHTNVPLHFINEEGVQKKGGVITHHMNDVEIACLPKDLPEFLEVDLAGLDVGDNIHLSDMTLPAGVTLVELTRGEDHDQVIVTISAQKSEAEVEADLEAPVEAPETETGVADDEDAADSEDSDKE